MAVVTIITEAWSLCSECGERAEMISYHVDADMIDPKCYACHTIAIVAAYEALKVAQAASEQEEGQGDNGTTRNGKRVRRRGARGNPASDLATERENLFPVGPAGDAGIPSAGAGTDGQAVAEQVAMGDGLGTDN